MKPVIEFLEKNGFVELIKGDYGNSKCIVNIGERYYTIINAANNDKMYSQNLNIYWLIGVLTYYGYMDKNYKQLN